MVFTYFPSPYVVRHMFVCRHTCTHTHTHVCARCVATEGNKRDKWQTSCRFNLINSLFDLFNYHQRRRRARQELRVLVRAHLGLVAVRPGLLGWPCVALPSGYNEIGKTTTTRLEKLVDARMGHVLKRILRFATSATSIQKRFWTAIVAFDWLFLFMQSRAYLMKNLWTLNLIWTFKLNLLKYKTFFFHSLQISYTKKNKPHTHSKPWRSGSSSTGRSRCRKCSRMGASSTGGPRRRITTNLSQTACSRWTSTASSSTGRARGG